MKTSRFAFLAGLFGVSAAAQKVVQSSTGDNSPNIAGAGKVFINGGSLTAGSHPNSTCPVCKLKAPKFRPTFSKKKTFIGETCGPLTVTAWGQAYMQDCNKQQERIIRCMGCNAAFWQDSET